MKHVADLIHIKEKEADFYQSSGDVKTAELER